jgi:putative FmdB family regulatory protein
MPIYEYKCRACRTSHQRMTSLRERDRQFCDCGEQLDVVPSVPAWTPSGKYGKAGGLNESSRPMHDTQTGR